MSYLDRLEFETKIQTLLSKITDSTSISENKMNTNLKLLVTRRRPLNLGVVEGGEALNSIQKDLKRISAVTTEP